MRSNRFLLAVLSVLGGAMTWAAFAQQPDDPQARGLFLTTRKKTAVKAPSRSPANNSNSQSPLGLGYTLYRRNEQGRPVRADESKPFHNGDALRLVIESNDEGYLYVFNTSNGEEPTMIFPNVRLNDGDDFIKAHVPYEIPSSKETNPRRRWFEFVGKDTTEQLYLIFSRQPLSGVPIRSQLLAQAPAGQINWEWEPKRSIWQMILGGQADTYLSQSGKRGTEDYPAEEVISRKIGLPPEAPDPSVIRVNKSKQAGKLVALLELILK